MSSSSTHSSNILDYRIPARLRELETFLQLAAMLASNSDVILTGGGNSYSISHSEFLWHPIADAAILQSRALLHFLGIGMTKVGLAEARWQNGDLTMKDVGLSAIPVNVAIRGWRIPESRARELLSLCILSGNKVSGHLTDRNAGSVKAEISELEEAFSLVTGLINRDVYDALTRTRVVFEANGPFGSISAQLKATPAIPDRLN